MNRRPVTSCSGARARMGASPRNRDRKSEVTGPRNKNKREELQKSKKGKNRNRKSDQEMLDTIANQRETTRPHSPRETCFIGDAKVDNDNGTARERAGIVSRSTTLTWRSQTVGDDVGIRAL